MPLQFIDLKKQYLKYKESIDSQINDVITNTSFIMGKKVAELEEKLARYVGVSHAISCSSGTDALLMALMAYDIEPGDEIITTPFTFISTSEVISLLKAKPVFVDIDPKTFNIDPQKIKQAITLKTKGIIAVNIFSQCADYDQINAIAKDHNLFVVEDAAQSYRAQYKGKMSCSLSNVGCTSFFPAKPLGCFGDGGMIFTNDDNIAKEIKSIRVHGKGDDKYDNRRIGINGRLDTIQAAVLLAKFDHYSDEIMLRNKAAQYYQDNLPKTVTPPHTLKDNLSVFAQYSLLTEDRDSLQKFLKENEIPTAVYYPKPLHLQSAYENLGYSEGSFPVAEETSKNIFSIPMHPFLTQEDQDLIINTIKAKFNECPVSY